MTKCLKITIDMGCIPNNVWHIYEKYEMSVPDLTDSKLSTI